MSTTVTFYVARNPLGDFSCGQSWVEDIADARLYRKIGPAKAAATRWAKENPDTPPVQILEWKLDIATATVLDMTTHTRRSVARIERVKAEQVERSRQQRLQDLDAQEKRIADERQQLGLKAKSCS